MKQYSFASSLILSFYSKSLYRDVGQNWQGYGFLYVFFLTILLTLSSLYFYFHSRTETVKSLQPLIAQLPVITIKDGNFTINEPTPHLIRDPKTSKVIAIIDPAGTPNHLQESSAVLLLTKNQIIMKENANVFRTYDLANLKPGVYDQEHVSMIVNYLSYILLFMIIIVIFILLFVRGIIGVLLLGAIAKWLTHTKLPYKTLCRIAAVALTPAIIVAIILQLVSFTIPYIILIYFIISLFYLFYGVEANKLSYVSPPTVEDSK